MASSSRNNGWLTTFCNLLNLPFGIPLGLAWGVTGCAWCITILGIPLGMQCFKMASLALWPFGKEVVYQDGGGVSFLGNLLWLLFGGLAWAFFHFIAGVVYCVTILGIPLGMQQFKLAKLSLFPFGSTVK